jgi:hypothetical protein
MGRNEKGQFEKGSGIHDLTNQRFGQLEVIMLAEIRKKRSYWLCQCDCGNKKVVRSDALISYKTISCGCFKKQQDKINLSANHKDNQTKERLYHIWSAMCQRCGNENNHSYENYGGRGIFVCDEWRSDYRNFREWAEKNGYRENLTIERIDVNSNYCPENCCWIPFNRQERNQRRTIRVTIDGVTQPLIDLAEQYGLNPGTVRKRYHSGYRQKEYLLYQGNLYDKFKEDRHKMKKLVENGVV